jgi:hypothetical protein
MTADSAERAGPPSVLKISGPADLIAAVPHLLGFAPRRSLVLVGERGPRRRISFTMRLDLPEAEFGAGDADCWRPQADVAISPMLRQRPEGVQLLVFTDDPVAAGGRLPWRGFVDHLSGRFRSAGVEVRDAICVSGGRWWSYRCSDPGCCPPEGTPLHAAGSRIEAAFVFEGSAPLADREELESRVAPIGGIAAVSLGQAFEGACVRGLAEPNPSDAAIEAHLDRWRRARGTPPRSAEHQAWAALVAPLELTALRDHLLVTVVPDPPAWLDLLVAATRHAPDGFAAPVASVLAAAAYADGNGALANVALDRALAERPDYSLAGLLLHGLTLAMPPETVRQAFGNPYLLR